MRIPSKRNRKAEDLRLQRNTCNQHTRRLEYLMNRKERMNDRGSYLLRPKVTYYT